MQKLVLTFCQWRPSSSTLLRECQNRESKEIERRIRKEFVVTEFSVVLTRGVAEVLSSLEREEGA